MKDAEESLWAIAEIQVIPMGVGVSVRPWIEKVVEFIGKAGFDFETHGYGTNVEGEISEVLKLVESIHRMLHAEGVPRVSLVLKLGTRTDKAVKLADKSVR